MRQIGIRIISWIENTETENHFCKMEKITPSIMTWVTKLMEVESRAIVCVKIVSDTQVDDLFMVFIIAGFFFHSRHTWFSRCSSRPSTLSSSSWSLPSRLLLSMSWDGFWPKMQAFSYQIRSNVYMCLQNMEVSWCWMLLFITVIIIIYC